MIINFDSIFKYIGYISVLLGILVSLVKLYQVFFKSYQKLGFSCQEFTLIQDKDKVIYNDQNPQYISTYKLCLERSYKNYNDETTVDNIEPKDLYVYKIEIKNIGKKNIEYKNFYNAEKLGFNINSNIIATIVNAQTPKYINASVQINGDVANIDFDILKPNDSIYITLVTLHKILSNDLLFGKTDDINKITAMDTDTANLFLGSSNYWAKDRLYIKEGIKKLSQSSTLGISICIISMIFFLILDIYVKIKKG